MTSRFRRSVLEKADMATRHDAISRPDSNKAARKSLNRSRGINVLTAFALSVAIYGMAEWIYVAVCAQVAPDTLHLPLTHLLPSLREDTSGVLGFLISFAGFLTYQMVRDR
jgi:hypothetical protein